MHVHISFKHRKYHFFSFMLWFSKIIDQILVLQYYTTKMREGISFLFFLGILFSFIFWQQYRMHIIQLANSSISLLRELQLIHLQSASRKPYPLLNKLSNLQIMSVNRRLTCNKCFQRLHSNSLVREGVVLK